MPSDARFVERFMAFVSGMLAIVVLQMAYGWWLNSGRGVLRTALVLLLCSMTAALGQRSHRWDRALAIWLGAVSGSLGVLFWIGPGSIWPIVLATAAALSGAAVAAGTLLGASARALWP